ncbi:MAG TPA: hypothetical protein VIJ39_02910 [Solirubrobacteraceae bacterium]
MQRADRVEALSALLKNTTLRSSVALLAAISCVCLLSACGGGSSDSAQSLLNETFSGHTPIESGNVNLSFALGAAGSSSSTKPLAVSLTGPFQSNGASKLPRFALQLQLSAGGHGLQAGATSTGSAVFVELAGTWFSTPASTYKSLEEGYAQATKKASDAKVRSTFSSLGIEPGRWLSDPSKVGTTTIGGVSTVHLTAGVNIPAFLADVTKLSQAGSTLGLGSVPGASTAGGTLSPTVITELAKSIKSAHVDVYTGQSDHLLRRLEVTATVTGTPQTKSLLGGLSSASLTVRLEFSDLNKPQTIAAPSNPQPPTQLLPALQQLVGVLEGSSGSSTGTSGGTLEPLS